MTDIKKELIATAKAVHGVLEDSKNKLDKHLQNYGYRSEFLNSYLDDVKMFEELISIWGCRDLNKFTDNIEKLDDDQLKHRMREKHIRWCSAHYDHNYQMKAFMLFNKQYLALTNDLYTDII
jgi:hypothetical protein